MLKDKISAQIFENYLLILEDTSEDFWQEFWTNFVFSVVIIIVILGIIVGVTYFKMRSLKKRNSKDDIKY